MKRPLLTAGILVALTGCQPDSSLDRFSERDHYLVCMDRDTKEETFRSQSEGRFYFKEGAWTHQFTSEMYAPSHNEACAVIKERTP